MAAEELHLVAKGTLWRKKKSTIFGGDASLHPPPKIFSIPPPKMEKKENRDSRDTTSKLVVQCVSR
jgi:hypothetical protein